MKIIQIATEFAPIAKAGGLGEVLLGLSRELTRKGHDVEIILPKYTFLNTQDCKNITPYLKDFIVKEKDQNISNTIWKTMVHECNLTLIEAHHPLGYFHRDHIYGYPDDTARFLYFCKAAIEYLVRKNLSIDIIHLHDWHVATCAVLIKDTFRSHLSVKAVLLTIHNMEYQGKCASWDLDAIGLVGKTYLDPLKLQDTNLDYPETLNLLKGGIIYANAVNTVSPTYAKEVLTPKLGCGLDLVLHKASPSGILNGIDASIWNPETDPYIAANFNPNDSFEGIIQAKKKNKESLQKSLGLHSLERPLVCAITRLVPQKGTNLLQKAVQQTLDAGGAFALLGSMPLPHELPSFQELADRYKDHPNVFLCYRYNDTLAHKIYAASDFTLVPSIFEPCGLTQLIALRYGSLPIVCSTGGLKDTVFDCDDPFISHEQKNGFVFYEPTSQDLGKTLGRAFKLWNERKEEYREIFLRALRKDYSWKIPAQKYLNLYERLPG